MASVKSAFRTLLKPVLFRLLGKRGYKWFQFQAKKKDIQHKLVEEIEMELLPFLIKSGDEVLDIGANFAYYTERLARLVPEGHVFAFEPIPFTYEVARMLIRSFGLHNVSLYQKGVGERDGILKFKVPKMNFGPMSAGQAHIAARDNSMINDSAYYVSEKNEEFDCDVVALDNFLLPRLKALTFVKIDIEGAEYFALMGMRQLLQKFRPVILIEIVPVFLKSFKIGIDIFQSFLIDDLGYQIYKFDAAVSKLRPTADIEDDRNYILIHRDKSINFRNLIVHHE